jgi:hypothetical protein
MNLEALPPNHRDLSLLARIAGLRANRASTCSHNPGPESALELLPSSALPSAQVFTAYPKIVALENRTFHLLFKPDILTCYEQLLHLFLTIQRLCHTMPLSWLESALELHQIAD